MTTLRINGRNRAVDVDADTPLLWALRDGLDLTGTKYGCGAGLCGACTVHLDGQATRACQLTVGSVAGLGITTIEGVSGPVAAAVQAAWVELNVAQCGYCQPGQVMAAIGLLNATPRPSDTDIDAAMSGNVCRCATYGRIRAAIHLAAATLGQRSDAAR